jgi:hypothetical protein
MAKFEARQGVLATRQSMLVCIHVLALPTASDN